MRIIHAWRYKKPKYAGASLRIGPLKFQISTGSTTQIHIDFKVRVNIQRTLLIRSDKLWSFKVMAYKGGFPRSK